ncbi:hypothetical protein NliqN6_1704 [Naganishia liquefaciens]|uniref:CBM21 domain-containing protein n=1 Tax=Naganishia liquefaciens TaxID=104408 RepID=A0A8H3YEJ0_9TREE|nr:hypothetical protein NliqN6_1704 [Naganishia liquefaciens]
MPYLTPISPGGTRRQEEGSQHSIKLSNKGELSMNKTVPAHDNRLEIEKNRTNGVAFSIEPPTPDRSCHEGALESADEWRRVETSATSSTIVEFPTVSSSTSTAAAAIPAIVQRQQTLPEVRSPPRRFKHFGSSSLWKEDSKPESDSAPSLQPSMDALASVSPRRARPRLFGFTEMVPDQISATNSSADSSRSGSRSSSPSRSPGLEMIPRSNRRASAMKIHERVSPPQSAAGTPAASPTPASAPMPSIPRRQSVGRSQSEVDVSRPAKAVPPRILARVAPKPSLSTRTSAQRNETALKLCLDDLPAKPADSSLLSPALPSPMIRKKSGEVVKPSLKLVSSYSDVGNALALSPGARSLPSTPSCPKFVHFDTHLERVKLFLHDQKPEVVSRNGSPVDCLSTSEGEEYPFPTTDEEDGGEKLLEIRLPNFPTQQEIGTDLYLESLFLDDDRKSLKGVIRVKNISFSKWVAVRFTLDWWSTINETSATYKESIKGGQYDRFQFTLKLHDLLHKIEDKTMFIALRYHTDGREIWDNNNGQNYEVKFVKTAPSNSRTVKPARPSVSHGSGIIAAGMGRSIGGRSSQWDVHGKRDDRMSDLRAQLNRLASGDDVSYDDDDGNRPIVRRGQNSSPNRRPGGLPKRKDSSNSSNDLKLPTSPGYGPSSPLAQRYDFSFSLQDARSGKKTSPSSRNAELPASPTGISFPANSTKPSMEFYSPQLNILKDLPGKGVPSSTHPPATSASQPSHTPTLSLPQVAVQEPSPPADYFATTAPSATGGPDCKSPVPPVTDLPTMYSPLPAFMIEVLEEDTAKGTLGLTTSDRETSEGAFDALDDSPPSIGHSAASSITSADSPPSPAQPNLPRANSIDNLASLDYNSILEKFCWGGSDVGKFADSGVKQFGARGFGLDSQHSSSESDIPKYYINHLETYSGKDGSPQPIDRSSTPKSRFRNGSNQDREKGESFFKAVSRSLQTSPAQSPMATPGGRTAIRS